MSKDFVILTPNARRINIHCSADTAILQILEDVCKKQGLEARSYDLKHHNKILDLSTTVRFSNLPNKACLEMVELETQRQESIVTIGLQLEDGEKRLGEFQPNTTLFDVITSLAATELNNIDHPTILFMRQEILGLEAFKTKTLKHLGLLSGRAILRLLNKSAEELKSQANVSCVYKKRPQSNDENKANDQMRPNNSNAKEDVPTASSTECEKKIIEKENFNSDPINLIKQCKSEKNQSVDTSACTDLSDKSNISDTLSALDTPSSATISDVNTMDIERRLNIEDEVTFLGAQKAIAFTPPSKPENVIEDLPDDFYELTIDEIRKLHQNLQAKRSELENAPLMITEKREDMLKQNSEAKLKTYKNVVVRIQFPDNIILQGVFQPTDTLEDITNFIKQYLQTPDQPFNISNTTFKGNIEPKMSLLEAKFVPCVHLHFKWISKDVNEPYLKESVYTRVTDCDAASILASKYRAPSRRKFEGEATAEQSVASTSKSSKVPKWFKK